MQIIFWNNKQCEIKHKFFRKLSLDKNSWACFQKWLCLENTRWYSWIHLSGDDYSVINVSNFSYPNNFHLRESPSNLSTFLQMGNLLGFLNNHSLKLKKKIMKYPLSPQHPPPPKKAEHILVGLRVIWMENTFNNILTETFVYWKMDSKSQEVWSSIIHSIIYFAKKQVKILRKVRKQYFSY